MSFLASSFLTIAPHKPCEGTTSVGGPEAFTWAQVLRRLATKWGYREASMPVQSERVWGLLAAMEPWCMLPALQWSRVRGRSFRKEAAKNKRQRDGIGCSDFPQEEGVCISLVTTGNVSHFFKKVNLCFILDIFWIFSLKCRLLFFWVTQLLTFECKTVFP